jgi:oxygen-independent coproporphyrinogen-3 oxidase
MQAYSLYLHIPFCRHRCGYCDFNTYAGQENFIPDYVSALCREIELCAASTGQALPVHTIFFGGGTPSLLTPGQIERILLAVQAGFDLLPGLEITLEANPGTLSLEYLRQLHGLGVNRLSLGMQSANPFELRLLERQHDTFAVIQAASWARRAGFDNLNLDLIFGLPEQELSTFQHTLEFALQLQPDHFSLYALTLEHGTPLANWAKRGLLSEPDPDQAADMYEWASARLEQAGFAQYEISNWGKLREGETLACRHNLQYWRGLPYLGLGAGAHGFAAGVRTANVLAPSAYIQRCLNGQAQPFPRTPATQTFQQVSREAEIAETMMMGLRLTEEGVSEAAFQQRFGKRLEDIFNAQIKRLTGLGLIEWKGGSPRALRLTSRGRLLGNQVFVEFI